jgi:hypothetical protein
MRWVLSIALAARVFGCQVVDGDRILGRDLAAADPMFTTIDPEADIGAAPLPGVRRVFHPDELWRLARLHAIAISSPATALCFERLTELLTVEVLLPALKQALAMESAEIEILDYSRSAVPHGRLEFTRAGLSSSGLWRGRVVYGEGHSAPIWVKLSGDVERGDKIAIEVSSGGARLTFDATAESSGRAGDSIMVRNPESGRLFRAKVEGKGRASVTK